MKLSLLDLAGLIADLERLPGKLVPTLLRRIRMFDAKGLIAVDREEGRRDGAVGLQASCAARILSILTDHGFDADTLRRVTAKLNEAHDAAKLNIDRLIEDVASDKAASIVVTLYLDTTSGWKHHGVALSFDLPPQSKRVEAAIQAVVVAQAVTTIPLNDLLSPIVSHFEGLN